MLKAWETMRAPGFSCSCRSGRSFAFDENEYEVLKGALPRGYTAFERDLLAELL
jgi:hypothetical protein